MCFITRHLPTVCLWLRLQALHQPVIEGRHCLIRRHYKLEWEAGKETGPTSISYPPLELVTTQSSHTNYFVSTRNRIDDEVKLLICMLISSCSFLTASLTLSISVAHINAHTSKVALLRKLPDNWRQNISCEFK